MKFVLFCFFGLSVGLLLSWYLFFFSPQTAVNIRKVFFPQKHVISVSQKEIIGFLPYWFVGSAKQSYGDTITTLTYFGLIVGTDGKIQFMANEQEEEPGWHMLKSEALQKKLTKAKSENTTLSLLVFSGDADAIDLLVSDPVPHAKNLVSDVVPLMKKYGFTDLNIDIESTRNASDGAAAKFTLFLQEVKNNLAETSDYTLTVEITGNDLIRKNLIRPKDIGKIADYVVIMAYDFHYMGSAVTGAVAPIGGSEDDAEFDTNIVLAQAYKVIPREKIILGVPSYGYGWETLDRTPKATTLPGSGRTVSSKKADELIGGCEDCQVLYDEKADESYLIYPDKETGTIHQVFYPDRKALEAKVALATKNNLAGLAIWALGYENESIYMPLKQYKSDVVDITRF